jgi:hypothetical protein
MRGYRLVPTFRTRPATVFLSKSMKNLQQELFYIADKYACLCSSAPLCAADFQLQNNQQAAMLLGS